MLNIRCKSVHIDRRCFYHCLAHCGSPVCLVKHSTAMCLHRSPRCVCSFVCSIPVPSYPWHLSVFLYVCSAVVYSTSIEWKDLVSICLFLCAPSCMWSYDMFSLDSQQFPSSQMPSIRWELLVECPLRLQCLGQTFVFFRCQHPCPPGIVHVAFACVLPPGNPYYPVFCQSAAVAKSVILVIVHRLGKPPLKGG